MCLLIIYFSFIYLFFSGPIKVEDRDPRYLIPIFDELLCCLPESWRKALRCGVDYSFRKDFEDSKQVRTDRISNYTAIIENKVDNDKNGGTVYRHTDIIDENHKEPDSLHGDDDKKENHDIIKTNDVKKLQDDINNINDENCKTKSDIEVNETIDEETIEIIKVGDKNIPMITLNDSSVIYPQNEPSSEVNLDGGDNVNGEENDESDRLILKTKDN